MNKFLKIISVVTLLLFLRTSMALCADQVYFYYTDPAGTPLVMSDSTGSVVWRADYMPFGEESIGTQTVQNNKMFVGKEKDSESGLYYFGARYMDAGVGRFASPDAIGAVNPHTGGINVKNLHNPQRLNLYAYGLNNPHRYVDPDGNTPWDIIDIGCFAYSAGTFIANPTADNGSNLALDTLGLLPVVPALGTIRRVGKGLDKAIDASKTSNLWHKGTFNTAADSMEYHLAKHGKGRTIEQYTKDAMDFYSKNKNLGQDVILKDGTPGIKIQAGTGNNKIGGYWTKNEKLVTFWD